MTLSTGSSTLDQAGSVSISTGTSSGPGSILSFLSGKSFDSIGGSTIMSAGDGANVGGSLLLSGGHDVSTDAEDDDIKTGGIVNIIGGTSTIGNGGLVSIAGGASAQGVGGNVQLVSGNSNSQASGDIILASSDGSKHEKRASGDLYISSGLSYDESSPGGSISIESGTNMLGPGGSISIKSNDGLESDGGNVDISAGGTDGLASKGGSITIAAGLGSNDGGFFNLSGGYANGRALIDNGGSINVRGGDCKYLYSTFPD